MGISGGGIELLYMAASGEGEEENIRVGAIGVSQPHFLPAKPLQEGLVPTGLVATDT